MKYISSRMLAEIAGVSPQAVQKALLKIHSGGAAIWRGAKLDVRVRHGQGGKSGIQYEVGVLSLPTEIQARLQEQLARDQIGQTRRKDGKAQAERNWKLATIHPALQHPKGSSGRRGAIEHIAAARHVGLDGNVKRLSIRTIYDWIGSYERSGSIHALARTKRADAGVNRYFISRAWDGEVPFEDSVKLEIAESLKAQIRGLWQDGARVKIVCVLASDFLKRTTIAYGFEPDDAALDHACRVSKSMAYKHEAGHRKVYRHMTDRKASEDAGPRVKRTIAGLRPMECVVADVHHINVVLRRADGSTATPKAISWMDIATGRVWIDIIFFESRGGVRNVDAIESFLGMAQHPAFGLPEHLYCDNGSEYNFADWISDALDLNVKVRPVSELQRDNRVVRALPYNAAAKPIEGFFGRFEQAFLRHIPGWIDDDRMNAKSGKLGKVAEPFHGSFEDFEAQFYALLKAYEHLPQSGQIRGRSPAQQFKTFIDAVPPWKATIMSPNQLLTVFTKPERRVLRNQAIQVDGRIWTCDALDSHVSDSIIVRVPVYHGFNALHVEDESGNAIGTATPQEEFGYLDSRGAKSSAQRKSRYRKAITQKSREVPKIDVGQALIEFGKSQSDVIAATPEAHVAYTGQTVDPNSKGAIVPRASKKLERDQMEAQERSILELEQGYFTKNRKSG